MNQLIEDLCLLAKERKEDIDPICIEDDEYDRGYNKGWNHATEIITVRVEEILKKHGVECG